METGQEDIEERLEDENVLQDTIAGFKCTRCNSTNTFYTGHGYGDVGTDRRGVQREASEIECRDCCQKFWT